MNGLPPHVSRCGCQARLRATVLARQCLDQLILINKQVKRMITNRNLDHCLANGAGLVLVECLNCCALDLDHSVCLCVVVVCHDCIIPSRSSIVKANQEPIWNYSRLDLAPSLPLEATVKPHAYDGHCCCHADGE